jgi:hypothetical protein
MKIRGTCGCSFQEHTVKVRQGKVYEYFHCAKFNAACVKKISCKDARGNMQLNYMDLGVEK